MTARLCRHSRWEAAADDRGAAGTDPLDSLWWLGQVLVEQALVFSSAVMTQDTVLNTWLRQELS